jgi:hypothetical protein
VAARWLECYGRPEISVEIEIAQVLIGANQPGISWPKLRSM